MKAHKKSTLEQREIDRLAGVFLAMVAGSARDHGRPDVARSLTRRAVALQPASLIHNGRKARK